MILAIYLVILFIQLLTLTVSSTYQEEQERRCSKKRDCFSCFKISNCHWNKGQCIYSTPQKRFFYWYEKVSKCKIADSAFRNKVERFCVNLNARKLPFNAVISQNESLNNVTDIFCDWSMTTLSPYKEYQFIFYYQNMTQLHKSNFVLVLNYIDDTKEEKRLFSNYSNKTIGLVGFTLYYHSNYISVDNLKGFYFKVQEVKSHPYMVLILILVSLFIVFFVCVVIVMHKQKSIQMEKEEEKLQRMKENLERIRQMLKPIQYLKEKEEDNAICSICLESFTNGCIVSYLRCYHVFHYNCIKKWIETSFENPKCPNCNQYLIENLKINERIALINDTSITVL